MQYTTLFAVKKAGEYSTIFINSYFGVQAIATYHCMKNVHIRSCFCSTFSRIWTEYGASPYLVQRRENTDKKELHIWTLFTQWLWIGYLNQTLLRVFIIALCVTKNKKGISEQINLLSVCSELKTNSNFMTIVWHWWTAAVTFCNRLFNNFPKM